ncbi:MAG TPA: antibiotic biosynthesis monooxygenase [Tenacibaculum sp.]|nr:antibiotic biosynthesis monooxygenase [Tenacibaculum sp.]
MLIRIVKLSFSPENINEFIEIFNINEKNIRNFKGCRLLELYRDKDNPNIFFTYSYWDSEEYLESYRNSELFKNIWAKTKTLFNDKPMAWSVNKLNSSKTDK